MFQPIWKVKLMNPNLGFEGTSFTSILFFKCYKTTTIMIILQYQFLDVNLVSNSIIKTD